MSDSESDAPEAITLSQSARAARGREQAMQELALTERREAKERNRARDERLKSQVAGKREKKRPAAKRRKVEDLDEDEAEGSEDDETRRLQARMERAMAEAGSEDDSEEGEEDEFMGIDEDALEVPDDFGGQGSSEEDGADDMEEDMDSDEDEELGEEGSNSGPTKSGNYLPDHVFAAAAAALPKGPKRSALVSSEADPKPQRKRKRAAKRAKDIVIGPHAVRTLPSVHRTSAKTSVSYTPAPGATTAPARINRFLSKSLALKGQRKRTGQGWERKPVNIGLFKRNEGAPVSGFVRVQ
ncbi:hypothetical protein PENSPDRAFT_730800 [Peniophora sp. CONT]|nr:hypothetical protein PENSPDRAFT_730800 [Peniophora sp. CONT]